jgi:hypothetical protein
MKNNSPMSKKVKKDIIHIDKREICENNKRDIENNSQQIKVVSSKTIINMNPKAKIPPTIMLFQAFAYLAATKLRPATNRVLNLLFSMTAYENYIGMDIKTIADTLKMTERSIITAIGELCDSNIVLKIPHPSDKRRNDYFINPTAAWKGGSQKRIKAKQRLDKTQLTLFKLNELP